MYLECNYAKIHKKLHLSLINEKVNLRKRSSSMAIHTQLNHSYLRKNIVTLYTAPNINLLLRRAQAHIMMTKVPSASKVSYTPFSTMHVPLTKILVALSAIGAQQYAATNLTEHAASQILDYCSAYPNDGIIYRSSDMILCAHSDYGFHNKSKGRSRAGAHIFLSEDRPMPKWNGPVLTLASIIKLVMSSAHEAELGALFITAKEMVPMSQTLEEVGWPQPTSPIQTDNSATVRVVNNIIAPRKVKAMEWHLHWIGCL